MSAKGIKVTTYNVLSSSLARSDYFTFCNPKWLSSTYRLKKLKEKMDLEVSKKSIICLQEVSMVWAGALHGYFASRGYQFITGLYGGKFNGYMGVAVAVPLSEYDILDADITRIADTKTVARKDKKKGNIFSMIKNIFFWPVVRFLRSLGIVKEREKLPWDVSLDRFNQMVSVRLQPKDKDVGASKNAFVVGTYHMPCIFRTPQVMMIHCALSAQHIHKYAAGSPYVYCGDFNIKPDSPMYSMLTQGKVDESIPEYPTKLDDEDSWKPDVVPLKSAYKEFLGKEPEYTNNAHIKNEEPFIETLDYIFTSSEHPWKVQEVEPLDVKHPAKASVTEPLPSENEPSDHILLSSTFTL